MAIPIEMPKLGNTVEECLLAKWLKRPGDPVAEGDLLAEIETDKATFELTAPSAGTLLATFFDDGDLVPVFTNVCVIGAPGEDIEPFRPVRQAVGQPVGQAVSPAGQVGQAVGQAFRPATPTSFTLSPQPTQLFFSPRAKRFAETHDFWPETVIGSGPGGRVLEEDLKRLYFGGPRTSSLARELLKAGHEPRGEGSGPAGLILSSDLGPPPEKMSNIRERIARRMRDSLASTAQYTMNTSADATAMLALRARIKDRGAEAGLPDININDMVIFAAVKALEQEPALNVEFVDGRIYRHASVRIGFACDTPRGLLVPVIKDCEKLTLPALALLIRDLTRQALEGSISPDDLTGATFTVSNLGIYGVESFSPILNPPQVAILGVNAIDLKPVRKEGKVEFVEHIGLSLTCDHQVIDGAPGARFLKLVRDQIENIESIAGLEI